MIVGLGEWGLHERTIEEHCKIAKHFGFRYMELGIGGDFPGRIPRDADQKEIDAVLACLRDYGIRAPFVMLENDFTLEAAAEVRRMIERAAHDIKLSAKLGATHVRLFTGFALAADMTEDRWTRMLQAFVELNALCAQYGMAITIETHGRNTKKNEGFIQEHTTTTDWHCLERLLRELPAEVGFNFDPGNLKTVAQGRSLTEYAKLIGSRINYCHLKDWKRVDDYWVACAPGDDDLDYDLLLREMSYEGPYMIEYEQTGDIVEGIGRSMHYLRSIRPDLRME